MLNITQYLEEAWPQHNPFLRKGRKRGKRVKNKKVIEWRRKRSNGEMNKASKEIALTSSLPAHDAGFLVSCPLWVHGTLWNVFFSPGDANWGSSQHRKEKLPLRFLPLPINPSLSSIWARGRCHWAQNSIVAGVAPSYDEAWPEKLQCLKSHS